MTGFEVDLDELDAVVSGLDRFGAVLADRLTELQSTVAALQEGWRGDAAEAQRLAHQRLVAGAQEMHVAVTELAAAARRAHRSYLTAAAANRAMWQQAR